MAKDASQRTDRKDSGNTWLPVVVAVLAVAGFLAWLATRQPPETVAVEEPGDTTEQQQDAGVSGTVTDPADLSQSASARALIGQTIELEAVPVQDRLGQQMFWIELPGGSPYLVKMDSALVGRGTALPATGSEVRVVGVVSDKTPAVLDQWEQTGALENADQRTLAEFGSTYIEAQRVQPARATAAQQ